ncbi:MAG TPA: DUF488 family protein [Patescibacteria group bacterium]|nr:DUF488 family protein [Patescibacteria group bacterium]
MIRIKRVYEPASPEDGARFLVERLWPRGIRKEALPMDGWLREVAPSTALRQWFAHDPAKWQEFQRRGRLTLLYSARDNRHNSAVVLKAFLEEHAAAGSRARRGPGREEK